MWVGQEGYSSIIQYYCMVHYHFGLTMLLSVPVTCWSNLKLLHVSGLKCWSSINKNYCMKPGHRYLLVQSIVHFWLAQIFKILVNSTLQSTSFDYMWSIFADFGTLMSIVFSVISAKKGREDFLNRGGAVPRGRGGGELDSAELDTGSILNEWWMRLGMIWNVGQLGKCYPPRPKSDANEK